LYFDVNDLMCFDWGNEKDGKQVLGQCMFIFVCNLGAKNPKEYISRCSFD